MAHRRRTGSPPPFCSLRIFLFQCFSCTQHRSPAQRGSLPFLHKPIACFLCCKGSWNWLWWLRTGREASSICLKLPVPAASWPGESQVSPAHGERYCPRRVMPGEGVTAWGECYCPVRVLLPRRQQEALHRAAKRRLLLNAAHEAARLGMG